MLNGCHTGFSVFFTTSVLWQMVNLEARERIGTRLCEEGQDRVHRDNVPGPHLLGESQPKPSHGDYSRAILIAPVEYEEGV